MRIRTPWSISKVFYFNLNTSAPYGDESFAISLGSLYLGTYPTSFGVEICWGILNPNGSLR
jgi:hypothetical protein